MQSKEDEKQQFILDSKENYQQLMTEYESNKQKFEQEREKLILLHRSKVEYEEGRNKKLEEEMEKIKEEQKNRLQTLLKKHKDDLQKLKNQFQSKCEKIQIRFSNVVESAKNFGNAFIQRLDKQDLEHEKELDESVKQLQQEIMMQKRLNDKL